MMVQVEGTHFVRDTDSMGLSNMNQAEKDEYYAKVRMLKIQKQELQDVKTEINNLKSELSEIKQLIISAINK